MLKQLTFCCLFLVSTITYCQTNERINQTFQTDFFYGKPIEHDKKMDNSIQGNSYGFMLSYNYVKNENSTFNNLYNYPERGYSLLYQNFNSTVLGEVYGGYRHFTYNLTPSKKNALKLTTAFGLGYATKKYDAISNNQNIAIGSNFLVSAYLKLNYFQYALNEKLQLNTGISLLHFSNASIKSPNLGINIVSAHVGLCYNLDENQPVNSQEELKSTFIKQPIHFNLVARGGYNESLIEDSGLFPFYSVSAYASKQLSLYSTITGGLDFYDSKFLKNHIKYINLTENKNYNPSDYKRVGVFIGHELTQNKFALISQLGYTVYSHYPYISKVYERFGFKHQINDHLFSEVGLRVNLFRAEGLDFGIGYQF